MSAEARLKMSLAKIGRTPWNKGVSWSQEAKEKMSVSHKNNFEACENLRQMSISNKGIRRSPSTEFKKGVHYSIDTEFKKGNQNINWINGKRKTAKGYIAIYSPDHPAKNKTCSVMEHRLVIEKYIGRYLLSQEVVHHINKIKNDNRIENLMLFSYI